MNTILQSGYDSLTTDERTVLRTRLGDSPRAMLLLDFLEARKGKKFNTVEVVETIYHDEQDQEFGTLRNRFFKLRKHIISLMERNPVSDSTGVGLLPLEEGLYRCRQLISSSHFQQARKHLIELIAECRKLNVFEILPEALNLMVYCNMALNDLKVHERTLKEVEISSKVLDDLRAMQVLGRRVFLAVIQRNVRIITKHLQAMRRIVLRRSAYPRFELYYHFVVVTNAASVPGYSGKGHSRHLASLKKLIAKHPGMPAASYEPHGAALMQYYILSADGTHQYMRGDVKECYRLFREAWDIQDRIPNLRIRKSESHFKNKVAIEVATGRYKEAVQTAHDLVEFQKEHRQEEKKLLAYAELAMVYTYAYPLLKCPNPEFIARQLKSLSSLMKKESELTYSEALSTEAVFAFMCKDWKTVKRTMAVESAKQIFISMNLAIYIDLLQLSDTSPIEKVAEVKKKIHALLDKSVSADMVYSLRRALSMVLMVESEVRLMKK